MIATAVITSLLGLTLFTAFAMGPMTMAEHEDGTCFVATATQMPCPLTTSPMSSFAMLNLHSSFIAGFSSAVFVGGLLALVLTLLALLLPPVRGFSSVIADKTYGFVEFVFVPALSPVLVALRAWRALLEHSPTLVFARAV